MSEFLGIDTSNYTTSAAVYLSEENRIVSRKMLLPVKEGALGLRQSEAVFHHTKQLPQVIEKLFSIDCFAKISAVSASSFPCNTDGSYMPCFLCGEGFARSYATIEKIPFYASSHQMGHILAALYSADRLCLLHEPFIAFHISGGTTDCLLCEPDVDNILKISVICTSLDLNGGQAVDRAGIILGLKFPCGESLERLAEKSDRNIKTKPVLKDGNCCLSGLENKCRELLEKNEKPENIAKYCLDFIADTVIGMTTYALEKYGSLPVIYAGGVMSNTLIRQKIISQYDNALFAQPQFSCDNAAGIAIYAFLKEMG